MALIDKASLLMVPSTYEAGKLYNVLPSGNRAPDSTDQNSGYDQTRADFDFDRGSNTAATRVNADGLIEKYRENKLLQSNQFDTTWSNNRSYETSGQFDPDGGNNAWWFREDANTGTHILQQNVTPSSGVYTASITAKAKERTAVQFLVEAPSSYGFANFDLTDGSVYSSGDLGNVTLINSDSVNLGNGWYRLRITIYSSVSLSWFKCYLLNSSFQTSYTGIDGNGIYLYQAQLESGLVSTDYLESTSVTGKAGVLVDLPRINYDANGENGALLLEPSRQQLIQYSEYFGAWTLANSSLVANAITSPEGVSNAYKIVENTALGAHAVYLNNVFTADGTYKTASVFVKAAERTFCAISTRGSFGSSDKVLIFNLTTGEWAVNGSGQNTGLEAEDFGNGWWRIALNTNTTSGAYDSFIVGAAIAGDTWADAEYTGDGSSGIYVYGAMLETATGGATYPSSYIPNHGESGGVTRAADACSVTGASDVIGQTEGTLYAEVDWNVKPESGSPVLGIVTLNNGANNLQNCILLGIERQSGGTNRVYCFIINSNVTQSELFGSSITDGVYKIAFAYKANDFALYVNGSQIATDTSGSVPALSEVLLGKRFGTDTFIQSDGTKQVALFNERLSNAELAALTA